MSELRKDPVVERWVIIAPDRVKRPTDFHRNPPPSSGLCPFCPGHEDLTPPEVLALRPAGSQANGPDWSLRVVPNRFPALRVEGDLDRQGEGMFDKMAGIGAHEVIIESAAHDRDLADLSVSDVEAVLWTWSERMRDLARDVRLRAAVVFRNHGKAAGASLEHPHSQLIALPTVPQAVLAEMEGAAAHYASKERCLYCDIIRQERKDGVRVVLENDNAIAIAPWAPRAPFETWILPLGHSAHYEAEPREIIRALAEVVQKTLSKIMVALERPAYNLMLHSAPLRERGMPHYHWHLEIMPAVTNVAGFEWGSGFFINPVSPEEAAAFLRKTNV